MLNVKKVATVALSSALANVEAGQPLSPTTIREIRVAHSLLTDGLPSADELRPFLGGGWMIRPRNRSARNAGVNAISETELALAQIRVLAVRLGIPERLIIDLLRCPEPGASPSHQDRVDVYPDSQLIGSRRGKGAFHLGRSRLDLIPAR
jgi:hypothetical protein